MQTVSHMIRDTLIAGIVVMALVVLAAIWPFETILYDEREPRHHPRTH